MKNLKIFNLGIFLLFLLSFNLAFAQSGEMVIKGLVTDQKFNQPLPGVNVQMKDSKTGTITDLDGKYTITVPTDQPTVLVFSFIGCATQEIEVTKSRTLNVVMADDTQVLEEVVVVAYGTQSKISVTSAMSSVDNKELLKSPVASVTNSLAGSIPGVTAVQSSGQPGKDDAAIYVRGCGSLNSSLSQPLVLVDGVEREFSQIDPNEIQSISVLKDASATAVFGVRGANGVILVTTRRGKVGKPTISATASIGLQQPISFVEQVGSYEFAKFWNTKQRLDNVTDPKKYFQPYQLEAYRTNGDPMVYPSTNWMDYLFNDIFLQSKNNINISGGSENVRYFVSMGYLYQNGLMKKLPGQPYDNNYRYNRFNFRANVDARLSPTTTMKVGIGGNVGVNKEPNCVENVHNPWNVVQIWSLPFSGPGFVDGVRTIIPRGFVPTTDVMRDGMFVFYGRGYKQEYRTTLNMDVDITQKLDIITKGLSISVKGAYDNRFNLNKLREGGGVEYQEVTYKSYFEHKGNMLETNPDYDKTYVFSPKGADTPLQYSESKGRDQNWYVEARINYDRTFKDHKVSALLLYNQSRDYYPVINGKSLTHQWIPRSYIGLVGRANYSYANRYMFDFSIGYNGSENFAPGKTRFGVFPSVSLGWVLSEEKWMKKAAPGISFFKIRASWGRVGNDQGLNSRFMYMPERWKGNDGYSFGVSNPEDLPAFQISALGNPLVTWETADKINLGLETTFFNERLKFNFDYFTEFRQGILIAPESTPGIIATRSPNLNIGKVNNRGCEVVLGWNDRPHKDWSYFIDANMSFSRNKIIEMDEVPKEEPYMNQTGLPTGKYTDLYKFERLYQYDDFELDQNGALKTDVSGKNILKPGFPVPNANVFPGDAMYADLNKDGVVDAKDRGIIDGTFSKIPEIFFGLNLGFTWKDLSFSMQWTGATNVDKMYSLDYRVPFTNAGSRGLLSYFYDGCWTPEHQKDAIYPRAAETSESWNSNPSTLWLQDASYFRLKNVNLSYTLKGFSAFKKVGIKSLALTFSGYNLLTFSSLKYIDPEGRTDDSGSYPLVKLYSFGLNINF